MEIAVSQLIVQFLERLGIGALFGMPGAHILPVYDRLYESPIRTVLVKHEQGAAFMAGGYARASGRIGACIATAGPGATNLVTGIASAYMDRLPVLIVTGETSTHIFGKGGLQESSGEGGAIDQSALFRGITRYHKLVERTDYLPHVLNKAAKILRSPNPGPVLLSFPFNVQQERVDAAILDTLVLKPPYGRPRPPAVAELAGLIQQARAPLILAGHGCLRAQAQAEVARLSRDFNIPVATSLKGKGVIDEGSALALGSLGVTSHGRAYRYLVEQADLLILLGAGFNERTSYLWDEQLLAGKRIAQIDHDPEQLDKVFQADLALHADIRQALIALLKRLDEQGVAPKARPVIEADPEPIWQGAPGNGGGAPDFTLIRRFFARLAAAFPRGALLFDDNILFAQNFFDVSAANRYFPNSGISSLGHAIPAAIGARFGVEGPTFAILGDGGFQMCGFELMTAVNYQIPLNVVLLNNGGMGLIRKNQVQLYHSRFIDCDFVNPDFARLADAFGIRHCRVADEADLDRLFADYDLVNGLNLIEIPIGKDAFPNYLSRR